VGIGVDTEEQVDAFHCALHFGHALKVEALPGIDISTEKTVLGTFWRDTAVEKEEIEYFATGHPIVEALFGFLRDGPYGRNAFRFVEKRGPLKAKGLEALFHLVPPEPADTSPGARVPSRQLSRFIERWLLHLAVVVGPDGSPKLDTSILPALEKPGRSLRGDEIRAAFPGFAAFVDRAMPVAIEAAEAEMHHLAERARRAIREERDGALDRMRLSLAHQGFTPEAVDAQLQAEAAHYEGLLVALNGLKVVPDSAAGFVLNR
jgi:ATP-dependent helicase HepA